MDWLLIPSLWTTILRVSWDAPEDFWVICLNRENPEYWSTMLLSWCNQPSFHAPATFHWQRRSIEVALRGLLVNFDKSLIDCKVPWKSPIKFVHRAVIRLSFDIVPIHILVQNTVSNISPHPRRWASSAPAQSARCIKIDVLCDPRQFWIPRHYSGLYCWRAANIYQLSCWSWGYMQPTCGSWRATWTPIRK